MFTLAVSDSGPELSDSDELREMTMLYVPAGKIAVKEPSALTTPGGAVQPPEDVNAMVVPPPGGRPVAAVAVPVSVRPAQADRLERSRWTDFGLQQR